MSLARSIARAARRALVLLALAGPAAAGHLHLENGGVIEARNWWIEGDWIYYDAGSGEVGLPRSMVVRIEGRPVPAGLVPEAPAARPAAAGTRTATGTPAERDRLAEANSALENGDFQAASGHYLNLIGDQPDLHVARVGYAISEMALGRDGMAISVVLDGLARAPEHPELNEVLGDLRNRQERVTDALVLWKEAFRLSPNDRVREKILKAERELTAGRGYDLAATSHFTVRFDGDVDRQLAAEAMDFLEEQYWDLSDAFRHAPPQPITVLLYPQREFRAVTQSPEWVGGIYDGKIRVPLGGLSTLTLAARGVLTHELTHAVVHSKSRGHCPRWLHEGLAQIQEGKQLGPAERREVRRILAAGAATAWDAPAFSYPAALSLTRFLEGRRGMSGLVWVLELLGEGADLDHALRQALGLDYAGLCRLWAESLTEEAR